MRVLLLDNQLPDGQEIQVGVDRFKVPELMFQPVSSGSTGIGTSEFRLRVYGLTDLEIQIDAVNPQNPVKSYSSMWSPNR